MILTTEYIAVSIAGAIACFSAGVQWGTRRANGKIGTLTQEVIDLKESIKIMDSRMEARVALLLAEQSALKGELIRLQTREEMRKL